MVRFLRAIFLLTLCATLALTLTGCAETSPEERIAKIRSGYEVQLSAWQVVKPPAPEPAEGEEAAAEEAEIVAEEGGEAAAEEPAGPELVNVRVDLVIYLRGRDTLPGITVDVTHASAGEEEKAIFRRYVDTTSVGKGDPGQADFVLEGVALEEGDAFAASILPGVPENLSDYREFSEPAP